MFPYRVVTLTELHYCQGFELSSAVNPGLVGSQAVLPNQMVPLTELCVQAGPQAGLYGKLSSQVMFFDQTEMPDYAPKLNEAAGCAQWPDRHLAVLCCWARSLAMFLKWEVPASVSCS